MEISRTFGSNFLKVGRNEKPKNQPDNILVDYNFKDGKVSKFECYLADWGTAGNHKGGTPMYAGPRTYKTYNKDLFSFGRLTLELFLLPEGNTNNF